MKSAKIQIKEPSSKLMICDTCGNTELVYSDPPIDVEIDCLGPGPKAMGGHTRRMREATKREYELTAEEACK